MMKIRTYFGLSLLFLMAASCGNAFKQGVATGPGQFEVRDHTFEILVMLLGAFLLGLWLGWILWSRYKQMVEGLRLENESLNVALGNLRGELEATKLKLTASDSEKTDLTARLEASNWEVSDLKSKIAALEGDLMNLLAKTKALETAEAIAEPEPVVQAADIPLEITSSEPEEIFEENLVEPIETPAVEAPTMPEVEALVAEEEPEMEELELPKLPVNEVVLIPFAEPDVEAPPAEEPVAEAVVEAPVVQEPETETVVIHVPDTVETVVVEEEEEVPAEPEVVEQAVEQIELPEPEPVKEEPVMTFTDINPMVIAPSMITDKRDDLKIVEGIGPKIEDLLFRNGIYTYTQLAATPVNRIKEILMSAGPSYAMHDPGTWPAQSLLAANGEWDNLRAYQGFLNAGKRPS